MEPPEEDFSACTALVVDGNFNSRSILVAQLRALGIGQIVQCIRTADARRRLEAQEFDFVLCELHFADERNSGQELLDDLRRDHLLPFSTVFFMVTGEATYLRVAEAAESALDGYLLKPHKETHLQERLLLARQRKKLLQEIFDAIAAQEFVRAADLCLLRFLSRSQFWLYAARVGAELLLRLGRHDEAQALYQAAADEKALPWARLGCARAQLEAGQALQACSALEALLEDDPDQADALDLLGRAQFELGQFDLALATYQRASTLTPSSITRCQNAGMMSFYAGTASAAERLLDRTTRLGLESKLYDPQALVLLALTRLELRERRGLLRCHDDFTRLQQREPDNARLQRLASFARLCTLVFEHDVPAVLLALDELAAAMLDSEFDFECAANLLATLGQVRALGIYCPAAETMVHTLGLRFCSSRPHSELLVACARYHPPYQEWIRTSHATIVAQAETALEQTQAGHAAQSIDALLALAQQTLNVRLIDNAFELLHMPAYPNPQREAQLHLTLDLRRRAGAGNRRLSLGRQARQAGGMVLRSGTRTAASAPLQRSSSQVTRRAFKGPV